MGDTPIAPEKVEAFENSGAVIVATFKGGPISVLEKVEESEDAESSADNDSQDAKGGTKLSSIK